MNDDGIRKHDAPDGRPQAERDLDRMLDLLSAPAPSETLRARLKRDFPAQRGNEDGRVGAVVALLRQRAGALAVAAALLLAVALGALMPPRMDGQPQGTTVASRTETAAIQAPPPPDDAEAADDLSFARAVVDDAAPDSAAFLVATLILARYADLAASDDAGVAESAFFDAVPLD